MISACSPSDLIYEIYGRILIWCGGDLYQTLSRACDFGSGLFNITATIHYGRIRLFRVYQELQIFDIKRADL